MRKEQTSSTRGGTPSAAERGSIRRAAAAVFVVALGLRLAFAFAFGGNDLVARFGGNREDPQVYDWAARNLLDDGVLGFRGEPSARRGPAYPLFLAGVYATAGDAPLRVRVVQSGVDAAAAVLILLAVAGVAGRRAGVLSGIMYAGYPIFVFNASEIMTEVLALVFLAGAMLALFRAASAREGRKPSLIWSGVCGVCCGLAALTRENLALVGVLWAAALLVAGKATRTRDRVWRAGAVALGFAVAYVPWVVRNTIVFDTFMPAGSSGGENLLRGAGLAREGSAFNWRKCLSDNGLLDYWAYHNPINRGAAFPDEIESDRRAAALAARWIREDPARHVAYGAEKVLRLLVQIEERTGSSGGALRSGQAWAYRLTAALGAIGAIVLWRRGGRFAVVALALLSLAGWAVIFAVVAWKRYRYVTFDLACVALTGVALDALIARVRTRVATDQS
ncbi:MAG: hypothetical protein FLDDKLPJ_00694 [Phycisphaerae bacterium]|nr:hypothetical protein [Phycisphaerae bacterium]